MNWGNRLLLTFIVFGAGIFYLVYRAVSTNFELVEKEYYQSELRYQQVIDGTNRGNLLSSPVKVVQDDAGVRIEMPTEMRNQPVSGDIWFYCAYDEKKDKKFPLEINSDGKQLFKPSAISPGKYTVKIKWNKEGINYFMEQDLTVL